MQRRFKLFVVGYVILIAIQSCSKKTSPSRNVENSEAKSKKEDRLKKADSTTMISTSVKRRPAAAIPKVIVVNDKFANKSVDGRYYYDVEGHRYWRSNKDGKYYLFNKSMATDAAFQKPQ